MGCDRRQHARPALVLPAQGLAVGLRGYRVPFSTNVERVALAAGHKGVEIEWIDVDEADRSPVEAVSGQSLVPVIVDGNEVVSDSPVIIEWLETRAPEPSLFPSDPARAAEVRVFVDWFNLVWKRPPNLIAAELEQPQPDAVRIAELSDRMRAALPRFEALLSGRDYLYGEFGAADVMAFPFLKYAVLGLPPGDAELFHRILVEHQPLGEDSPLHAWVRRVDAHPRS
ncbi:MAG TPA: glutathione S-transferase family protein [Gaiellaceae bacterium]|nr:glutathione S-transferase family protein [Gaiellaceae bacterium]